MPRWTKPALKDFDNVFSYIGKDNEDAAKKVAKKILEASENLDAHQQMGRNGLVSGTRELVIPKWPYIIIYRCKEKSEVEIIRILHAKQKWP